MDRNVDERDTTFGLKTEDNDDKNTTTTTVLIPLEHMNDLNGFEAIWTKTVMYRILGFHRTHWGPDNLPFYPFYTPGNHHSSDNVHWKGWVALNQLETIWTKTDILHVSAVSVLMLLTLLGNAVVIITILSRAELRKKRVNIFILNLAVGDLMVCFVSMPTHILLVVFDQWVLGAVACKLLVYGHIVSMASTTLLLTAMSIDKYQVFLVQYCMPHIGK